MEWKMDVTCQTITGMQLCLILGFYKEKTAAFCSLDHKAALRIDKHWEIKGTLGLQVLRHHKIESLSLLQHKDELCCLCTKKLPGKNCGVKLMVFLFLFFNATHVICEQGRLLNVSMYTHAEYLPV